MKPESRARTPEPSSEAKDPVHPSLSSDLIKNELAEAMQDDEGNLSVIVLAILLIHV